jgi:DNA recombination protein RmuC
MTTEFIILLTITILILTSLIIYVVRKLSNLKNQPLQDPTLIQWLQSMQQSLEKTNSTILNSLTVNNKNMTDTLQKTTTVISRHLENAVNVVSDTSKEIGKMNELGKSIKDLQMVLQSPKLRGNLGEEILSDMLAQIFPKDTYNLQYSFKTGARVDAAIKTVAGILCIDAKFPMESFTKMIKGETEKERNFYQKQCVLDVKKHIKDISQKYILVDEDTVDFAFMYVPSETVFLEISSYTEVMEFARKLRVYPVSPNTLYAHLQTVLLSFEGQKIEKKAQKILTLLRTLQKEYVKLDDNLQVLGRHLNNAHNQYANTSQQFTVLGQKLNQQELLDSGEE